MSNKNLGNIKHHWAQVRLCLLEHHSGFPEALAQLGLPKSNFLHITSVHLKFSVSINIHHTTRENTHKASS